MIGQNKPNAETRGRPRKEETRTLSPIYKEMFSDNSAIIHSCFLIYVFEVFVETKNEKRVGHKDGGFTIYDKISNQYCFDNLQAYLKQWDCEALLQNDSMRNFVKLLPALGPKIILKQICKLITFIVDGEAQEHTQHYILMELTDKNNQDKLNEEYPYMRFVPKALKQLKMDKNQRWDRSNNLFELIRQRVDYLWQPLLRIIIHTVFNCIQGKIYNKYFKPFFSDAENPSETYIGQLNLDQVVMAVRRQETQERSNRGTQLNIEDDNFDRLRKVRSVISDEGTRTVVRIIKAPQTNGDIEGKHSENIGLNLQSPSKIPQLRSEPFLFQGGGFNTAFKPKLFQNLNVQKIEQNIKKQTPQTGSTFKLSKIFVQEQEQLNNFQNGKKKQNSVEQEIKIEDSNKTKKQKNKKEKNDEPKFQFENDNDHILN